MKYYTRKKLTYEYIFVINEYNEKNALAGVKLAGAFLIEVIIKDL